MATQQTPSVPDLLKGATGDIFNFTSSYSANKSDTALRLKQLDILQASAKSSGSFSGMESNRPIEEIQEMRNLVKKQSKAAEKSTVAGFMGRMVVSAITLGAMLL